MILSKNIYPCYFYDNREICVREFSDLPFVFKGCLELKKRKPAVNGMTMTHTIPGRCYCEYGMKNWYHNNLYKSCLLVPIGKLKSRFTVFLMCVVCLVLSSRYCAVEIEGKYL